MLGLFVMALGVVLIRKAELGMSPISAIPAAIANTYSERAQISKKEASQNFKVQGSETVAYSVIRKVSLTRQFGILAAELWKFVPVRSIKTPFTLGNASIGFHVICVIFQIILIRKITLKTALQLPLAVVFGYIIDLYMFILNFGAMVYWCRIALCLFGIVFTALGIVIIVSVDLMLPAPDAFLLAVSRYFKRPLSQLKIAGDISWVCIAAVIEILNMGTVVSVGIGTLASMYLTGKLVGVFKRHLP